MVEVLVHTTQNVHCGRRGEEGREGREEGNEGEGGRKGGREGGIIAPNSCEGVHVVNECYEYVLKLISC